MKIELTERGLQTVNYFIRELEAKRKELLDAGKDTADDTIIPSVEDIISDIECEEFIDEDGNYYNGWNSTDNDEPLLLGLAENVDYIIIRKET